MSLVILAEISGFFALFVNVLSSKPVYELARRSSGDFTRQIGKLPLPRLLLYLIFRHSKDTASASSTFWTSIGGVGPKPTRQDINSREDRVHPRVWPYLSMQFARLFYSSKLPRKHKGYNVLAADTSAVEMPYSKDAAELFGFHKSNHVKKASDSGKVIARCGGLLDVINRIFVDYVIEPFQKSEVQILVQQLHTFLGLLGRKKTIILADRGYFSIALMVMAQQLGYKFCFRAKKYCYKNYTEKMKSDDEYIEIKLTRSMLTRAFDAEARDYLEAYLEDTGFFRVRVVKRYFTNPETGAVELGIYFTNLTPEEFSTNDVLDLYSMRWSIETAYMALKVVLELERHSSLKPYIAINEIYGKIMYYNCCSIFGSQLELLLSDTDQRISKKSGKPERKNKYHYKLNVKGLLQQLYVEKLIKCLIAGNNIEDLVKEIWGNLVAMINQLKTPIRKGRHYERWGKAVTASYKYKFLIDGRNHPKVALVNGKMRTVKP